MSIVISPFCPLIQLLAGIYLVLFTDNIFNINPIRDVNGAIKNWLTEYKSKFQGQQAEISTLIESLSKNDSRWQTISKSFRRIYVLSLLYCTFLSLYAGIETLLPKTYTHGMIPVCVTMLIYVIYLFSFHNPKHHIRKYGYVTGCFFLWVLVFILYGLLYDTGVITSLCLSSNTINIIALSLSFIGFLMLIQTTLIKVIILRYKFRHVKRHIAKYTKYFFEVHIFKTGIKRNAKIDKEISSNLGEFVLAGNNNIDLNSFFEKTVVDKMRDFLKKNLYESE